MNDTQDHDTDRFGGRLSLIRPSDLSGPQQGLYAYLELSKLPWAEAAGFQARLADGRLIGPFNVFLHAPEMSRAFNAWIDAEAKHSTLTKPARQTVILAVGVAWRAAYEVYAHAAVARQDGLDAECIRCILGGQRHGRASPDIQAAWAFSNALARDRAVPRSLYDDAVRCLGEQGVVDMVNLVGLYLATCALLNAFDIPAPTTPASLTLDSLS